ncbi:hypothetical protein BN1708_020346 [Verticillium longisporum]|uniref:Uncharacterized protein n=1 Tax=Verticillium longisporum TaxID=100787 RepID=A0A0G4MTU0_VERLO|nr:hypothetical protein BN1708_020346 [Verticillium longisporum]
MPPTSPLEDS